VYRLRPVDVKLVNSMGGGYVGVLAAPIPQYTPRSLRSPHLTDQRWGFAPPLTPAPYLKHTSDPLISNTPLTPSLPQ
jgi:hypothetical protein